MNKAENKKFLGFIEGLLPKDSGIYYDNGPEEFYFYFYTGMNVQIQLHGVGDVINFKFVKNKDEKEFSITIPFSEAEPLLDKILKIYQKNQTDQHLINSPVQVIESDFSFVTNYLKNNDLEVLLMKDEDSYKLHLKNENRTYDLMIMRVLNFSAQKRKINNIALLKIPMTTKDGSGKHAYCEFFIPSWKLNEFKAYTSIFYNDMSATNENHFINKLKDLSTPMANLYVYQSLDAQIPDKNSANKSIKI